MNRIQAAIKEGRCVLAIGRQALTNPDVLGELRRRAVPAVHLGGDAVNPVRALGADALAAVLDQAGGVLVLVEPEGSSDGRALSALGDLIKAAKNKPKIFVAARSFNPFMMPMNMRLLKMEGIKFRARDFISALPIPDPTAAPVAVASPKKKKRAELPFKAPKALFVGREEELTQFHTMLNEEGGPIVVTGPSGIGKRWFIEHGLTTSENSRWPDLTFGPGVGADTLIARIAAGAKAAGVDTLHQAITAKEDRPTPIALASLVAETLDNKALSGTIWVLHGLEHLCDRRRGHFRSCGRLEMILTAMLTSAPAIRLIIPATKVPQLYNEGASSAMRIITLGGLKGSVLHAMFDAHHIEAFPREKFGPIAERTMGHPMAARFMAITTGEDGDIDELLDQGRFLKIADLNRPDALIRHVKRRIEKLPEAARKSLACCALFRDPATTDDLRVIGIDRKARLFLIAQGLLEQTPVDGDRRYYVHPMTARHLEYREVYDFDAMEAVGGHLHDRSREALKDEMGATAALAFLQEGNRLLIEARRERSAIAPAYSDMDAVIDNLWGMIRRKKSRLDIARQRVNGLIKHHPTHSELLLLNAELHGAEKSSFEQVIAAYNALHSQCPIPDGYFSEADLHTRTRARGKAARAIEHGLKAFPTHARMYRRMALVLLDQNKIDEAIIMLKSAMALEPLMPNTYGLLADAYTTQGRPGWENALSALDEALALDGENPKHWVRKAHLLRDQGLAAEEGGEVLLTAADEAITTALDLDKSNPLAQELAAALILDRGGDLERAEWFLAQAKKRRDTSFGLVNRARLLIRKGTLEQVERLLTKALKLEPSNHAAFAAQSEMWEAQGQIFHAFEAIKSAKERSHKDSAARLAYTVQMTRLGGLIESGAAAEMMKAAGVEHLEVKTKTEDTTGDRRDAGTTTIRRPKKGEEAVEAAPEVKPEEAVEAAPEAKPEATSELTAELTAEEAPVVEAASEDTPQAPSEE